MDVFESIQQYYERPKDTEPDFEREWVESYLKELRVKKVSTRRLTRVWHSISMFLDYRDQAKNRTELAQLPFWEYSFCLQCLQNHKGFFLSKRSAKAFLLELLEFYKYLGRNGHPSSRQELERAIEGMFAKHNLRLVDRIPYTGDELWLTMLSPGSYRATFTIRDFWLVLLYIENGSWRKLREETRKAAQPDEKLELIESLYNRLNSMGYATPQKLAHEAATADDLTDAKRWFYRGKTPVIQWASILRSKDLHSAQ